MKLTISEIKNVTRVLKEMEKRTFPARMEYVFATCAELLEKELIRVEGIRIKLCEQYAEKDEHGNVIIKNHESGVRIYSFTDENESAFTKELNELYNTSVEFNVCKIPFSLYERCDEDKRYDKLTIGELKALRFLFEEE